MPAPEEGGFPVRSQRLVLPVLVAVTSLNTGVLAACAVAGDVASAVLLVSGCWVGALVVTAAVARHLRRPLPSRPGR